MKNVETIKRQEPLFPPTGAGVTLTLQQIEAHLLGAANILRGKTAGQDHKNYILSLMFYKRLCDSCPANDLHPGVPASD